MTYPEALAARDREWNRIRRRAAAQQPNHEAAQAVIDEWADEPPTAEERVALVVIALHDRMKEKCGWLRRLIAPEDWVMQDVDQSAFGLVGEVISQIGGLPEGLTWGQCYLVAMDAAVEWAEEHGEPAEIVRDRHRPAPPESVLDAAFERAEATGLDPERAVQTAFDFLGGRG